MGEIIIYSRKIEDALECLDKITKTNELARAYFPAAVDTSRCIHIIQERSERDHWIIASKAVDTHARGNSGNSSLKEVIFKRMEINYRLLNNGKGWFGLYLNLLLFCDAKVFTFTIAKTENDDCSAEEAYSVERDLLIDKVGYSRIIFENLEDFQTVINFCDEVITGFNKLLPEGGKLIKHLQNF